MGPACLLPFWTIIGLILGSGAGILVAFVVVPFYKKHRRRDAWLQRLSLIRNYRFVHKAVITAGIAVLTAVLVDAYLLSYMLTEIKYEGDYWMKAGNMADFSRWPLEYPYQMTAGAAVYDAELRIWDKPHDVLISEVTAYYKTDDIIVGKTGLTGPDYQYFALRFKDGERTRYPNKATWVAAMRDLGLADEAGNPPELVPVGKQYLRWLNHREEYAAARRQPGQ